MGSEPFALEGADNSLCFQNQRDKGRTVCEKQEGRSGSLGSKAVPSAHWVPDLLRNDGLEPQPGCVAALGEAERSAEVCLRSG